MITRIAFVTAVAVAMASPLLFGDERLPEARPVPDVTVTPLPYDQASFQHRGRELTRYHFGPTLNRPFLFPLIGPAGCSYTRMGHPQDPIGHSHHNSVWISHQNVNGVNFWEDGDARIVCEGVSRYEDGLQQAALLALNAWQDADGKTLMIEQRRVAVEPLDGNEWLMFIDIRLDAPENGEATLNTSPFGLIGVRMAKTIGVRDGGGRILNSDGLRNEKEVFRKPARWVDYSGPAATDATGGITLMNHPANPNHPVPFHVRDDGWMGASLTLNQPLTVRPAAPLRLRYGLWIHAGIPGTERIDPLWKRFAQAPMPEMGPPSRGTTASRPALIDRTSRPAAAGPLEPRTIGGEPIAVFRDPTRYTSFPDVERLPDGRLLCVFRDASFPEPVRHIEADARVVGSTSSDGGRTWSRPFVIYDDPDCQNDPSVAVLGDGRLLLNFFNWVGRSEAYVKQHNPPYARRVDRGVWGDYAEPGGVKTLWGKARSLEWESKRDDIKSKAEQLLATSSSAIETSKGTLLLPVYGRSTSQPVDQAYVLRSTDGGRTWSDQILLAVDAGGKIAMQEPALVENADGTIIAVMRTTNAQDHMFTARSDDDGLTWSSPERLSLIGHPADLVRLPDKRVLLVYGYRHQPFGVRACVSDDGGKTWDVGRELVIAASGVNTDLGYPSVCLADDRHVVVVYYMNGPNTRDRWIECKRIAVEELN
ncbi:MAG: PmoA family protein [Phycisphaerae bacterium]|nr:PmoA family protein [Phycisphaerae bacterium]